MVDTCGDFSFQSRRRDLSSLGRNNTVDACGDLHYQYGILGHADIKETCSFPRVLYFVCKPYRQRRYKKLKVFTENKSQNYSNKTFKSSKCSHFVGNAQVKSLFEIQVTYKLFF